MKTHSSFFNSKIIARIRYNLKTNEAAAKMAADFILETSPWMGMSYDELRALVFSPSLKRSWFVRSDGNCPACGKSVPMYSWQHNPFENPWKMKCPHCAELFPKNDFAAYYKSGLDNEGVFHHEYADKSLLINDEGIDFGVDDGNGWYDSDGRRYMFIGAYLSHCQWSNLVTRGLFHLGFSFVLSGDIEYARKAAVLLTAIARFWPDYDFYTQGVMYEKEYKSQGYVNYWVNSNREVRMFALAYDQIFDSILSDSDFEAVCGMNPGTFCETVETRILNDALNNIKKIMTNPPETPQTVAIMRTVLNHNPKEIEEYIDDIIVDATRVDGLSGESGLGGYAAITPRALADLLCLFTNTDKNFIAKALKKHPQLYKTYRFHIDTWYDAKYYPGIGDSSVFALPAEQYTGLFSMYAPLTSKYHRSREWFAITLAEYFDDPDIAKTIFLSGKRTDTALFNNDFYIRNPAIYEKKLSDILDKSGVSLNQKSINYSSWRVSVLHSGEGNNKYMLAMPYDSGKNHCHEDALSLHLFSRGLNVTPDYGYPPVNHGGWNTKEALWYRHPAAHNQVVVDGKLHTNMPPSGDGMFYRYPSYGKNIMFCNGSFVQAAYNAAPEYNDILRNERLIAIVEFSKNDSYCLDISRTEGGNSHSKFLHGTYSSMGTNGLDLKPGDDYYPDKTILRHHMTDNSPEKFWSADWKIYADKSLNPTEKDIHMKYTGLSTRTSVSTCESWVDITRMAQASNEKTGNQWVWIPTIYETHEGPGSVFTGIIEIYEDNSKLQKICLPKAELNTDFDEAIKVIHNDGIVDYIIANDPESHNSIKILEPDIETDALLAVIRFCGDAFLKASVSSGSYIIISGKQYTHDSTPDKIEFINH